MAQSTIVQKIREFLDAGNEGMFEIQSDNLSLRAQFSNIDTMSCSLAQLTIGFAHAIPNAKMRDMCDGLSAQLNYLLEPIVVIECDADLPMVQMRSNPPQTEAQIRRYYELTGASTALTLCRYEKRPDKPRVQIDYVLTNEVAVRLAGDLLTAVSE